MTTISQGLRLVKKLKNQLTENLSRASLAVSYDTKNPPAFEYQLSLAEANRVRNELISLETRIAVANATTVLELEPSFRSELGLTSDPVMIHAVRLLQELKGQITWVRALNSKARASTVSSNEETVYINGQYTTVFNEVTTVCSLPELERSDLVASLQDRFDRLNDLVETKNHQTVLLPV